MALFSGVVLWEVYRRRAKQQQHAATLKPPNASPAATFTVKSGSSSKTLEMLSLEDIDLRLTRHAASMTLARPGSKHIGLVVSYCSALSLTWTSLGRPRSANGHQLAQLQPAL